MLRSIFLPENAEEAKSYVQMCVLFDSVATFRDETKYTKFIDGGELCETDILVTIHPSKRMSVAPHSEHGSLRK